MNTHHRPASIDTADVVLERDSFCRNLLRELSGTLQEVVGLEAASGFVSIVGQRIGTTLAASYREALSLESLPKERLAEVLVDLKRRIEGKFYVIEETSDKIVFGNSQCPFGDFVLDRPALCMMTSNVFGSIVSESTGYAKVTLDKTIARRDGCCQVTVYLRPSVEAELAEGRQYYGPAESA